ncbi:MAG: isoprenylcysteine carboxylmethyltransferase family protein [Chitinispirillaceae bacterium]|nr:isoprenylcysteine carboxylmethyltransferase family protein [Chitinispirillaceae bacterium]
MQYDQIIIIGMFSVTFVQMVGFGLFLRINKLSMGGTPPINPLVFKNAKAAMMFTWIALIVQAVGVFDFRMYSRSNVVTVLAVVSFFIGALLQFVSYIYLGKNLKFGIPDQNEARLSSLRTNGLYKFSRNPMYVGFFLMIAGSSLYTLNPLIWVLSLFAIVVHHLIVLREEQFLLERFGNEWKHYASHVRRYI